MHIEYLLDSVELMEDAPMAEESQIREPYEAVTPPLFFTPTTEPFTPLSPVSPEHSPHTTTTVKQNPPFNYEMQREEISRFFYYPNSYQNYPDLSFVRPTYPYVP